MLNAVVEFKIANIFESAPKLPNENKVNGIALFDIAKTNECFQTLLNNFKYLGLNKIGIKTSEAIINLA